MMILSFMLKDVEIIMTIDKKLRSTWRGWVCVFQLTGISDLWRLHMLRRTQINCQIFESRVGPASSLEFARNRFKGYL